MISKFSIVFYNFMHTIEDSTKLLFYFSDIDTKKDIMEIKLINCCYIF